jgi:glycosyltransferase involved in cell wall biosynthesis
MHLVINATELGRQRGGNESYIRGVIDGLAALKPALEITLLTCDWDTDLELPAAFRQVNLGPYRRLPFFLWQQTAILKQLQADWYLANFFLPPVLPCRGAVLVYDLSFRAHPEYFPRTVAWYMAWLTGIALKQAACVFTISEFSRQELFRFYPVETDKVFNIRGGVGPAFRPLDDPVKMAAEKTVLARYGINQPYIFALGNIHPRKNLARLLEAYLHLQSERDSVPAMVWGGLKRWDSGELLDRARAAGVVLPGFIAQEDLPALYRQAEMLVYPSLYEGFGLPPAEAMACGTPVITSNRTSLPEVVGQAALTIDPTRPEEITAAMARLLDEPALRKSLRQAGIERARRFTWEETARQMLAALEAEQNPSTARPGHTPYPTQTE